MAGREGDNEKERELVWCAELLLLLWWCCHLSLELLFPLTIAELVARSAEKCSAAAAIESAQCCWPSLAD